MGQAEAGRSAAGLLIVRSAEPAARRWPRRRPRPGRREQTRRSVHRADCLGHQIAHISADTPYRVGASKDASMTTVDRLHELLAARILLIDGAMGTMIQRYRL